MGFMRSTAKGVSKNEEAGGLQRKNKSGYQSLVFKPREAELIEKMKGTFELEILHCGSSKKQIEIIKGNADMYLKAGPCSEWDTAPGQLMVEEFGGTVFRQDTFETMAYNKPILKNPHFVMLNERLNMPDFVAFMQQIIQE